MCWQLLASSTADVGGASDGAIIGLALQVCGFIFDLLWLNWCVGRGTAGCVGSYCRRQQQMLGGASDGAIIGWALRVCGFMFDLLWLS